MANLQAKPDPVNAGSDLTIEYSGGTPNTTITIKLDNGKTPGEEAEIHAELDSNGDWKGTWEVPASGWSTVAINAPGAQEETVIVT